MKFEKLGGMMKTYNLWTLISAISILSACTSGYQFKSERFADLDLHKVKGSEYASIFGEPFKTNNMIVSGDKYQIAIYHFGFRPFFLGNPSVRTLLLEFKNDELNAYLYASSFNSDKTSVDISKVDNIKIGISAKDDVLTFLGSPHGKAICPSQLQEFKDNCAKAQEVWEWMMFKLGHTGTVAEKKFIIIMFDQNGKAVDLKTSAEIVN